MTKYVIAAMFLVLSTAGFAECSPSDFTVVDFQVGIDNCRGSRCPKLNLAGKLVNNCSEPAAAQIEIEAKNDVGRTVDSVDGWPAMTSNINPGESKEFDFGPLMSYKPSMVDFSVAITDVKSW